MRTIDLDLKMNFVEALQYLADGKCVGIRPEGNSNFLVKYKPTWMNKESPHFLLCWSRSVKDGKGNEGVRISQYLGQWTPVVIDCNNLPEKIDLQFILEDISGITSFEFIHKPTKK